MEEDVQELQRIMAEQQEVINSLRSSTTVPLDIRAALTGDESELEVSVKTPGSESQAVDEAGSATYNVLTLPDGFLKVTIAGVIYNIPYYS